MVPVETCNSSSLASRTKDTVNVESTFLSQKVVTTDMFVHDDTGRETTLSKGQRPDSEPVQS